MQRAVRIEDERGPGGRRSAPGIDARLAGWIANVFAPPVIAVAAVCLVARAEGSAASLWWALAYLVVVLPVPLGYLVWLLRRGAVTDFHVPRREERTRPFIASVTCATVGLFLLDQGGAPPLLTIVAAGGLVLALILFAVTLFWKVSAHTAAVASLAVLAIGLHSGSAAPVSLAVPLVAWSRVRLGRHDRAQAVAGTLLGAATTAVALRFAAR